MTATLTLKKTKDWREIYASRVTTADDAVKEVTSGDRLFLTGNASVPAQLLEALVKRAPNLKNVEICQAVTICPSDYVAPEMDGHLRINSMFISPNVRPAIHDGRADFTPVLLSEFPLLFKNGHLPLDVAIINVAPPDDKGFCSLGTEAGLALTAAESAKKVIAQVNSLVPRTLGDTFLHVSRMTKIIEADGVLPERHMGEEGDPEVVEQLARHIAELVPDGATMQMGIGSLPDAVLKHLFKKKDLGIHSELISDGVIDLVDAGVVNCSHKTLHKGKIVCGFLLGTRRLYDWAHNNPMIEMHRTEHINDPFVIMQNDRMVSINAAIEVDFTGQICADSIGPKLYSAVGGQLDFVYGASRSKGGLSVITMPSTTKMKDETVVSRIVPLLKHGSGVVTSRNHVRYVVTEYGVADLYAKTIRQRCQALINIAHPKFRAELKERGKELKYL